MYFVSFVTVNWIDVLTRYEYKDEMIKCWQNYPQKKAYDICLVHYAKSYSPGNKQP